MAKPTPRVVSEVCSLCGLDWQLHGKDPTTETCIGLLLAEVQSLNARLAVRPLAQPLPYPVPYPIYPRPLPPWRQPWIQWYNSSGQYTGNTTPLVSNVTPRAIRA